MRSFVALQVPEELTAPLLAVQAAIPEGRPVPPENLHLTLAFLGEVAEPALDLLISDLADRRLPSCRIVPRGLALYGGSDPKLLAVDMEPLPDLLDLQAQVVRAARAAGLDLKRERFRPHVTLVRFGRGLSAQGQAVLHRRLAEIGTPDLPDGLARQAALFASTLRPGGAEHEPLAVYRLS
jgi:2'-5' RNA ligase